MDLDMYMYTVCVYIVCGYVYALGMDLDLDQDLYWVWIWTQVGHVLHTARLDDHLAGGILPPQVNKLDFCIFLASFCGTLFISVEIGLAIAVGLHVLIALWQTAFPHTAALGRIPASSVYRYACMQLSCGI